MRLIPDRPIERTALDGRHGEVELEAFGFAGQRQADRMEQRLALLRRCSAHALRHRAERVAIERAVRAVASSSRQRVDHGHRLARLLAQSPAFSSARAAE